MCPRREEAAVVLIDQSGRGAFRSSRIRRAFLGSRIVRSFSSACTRQPPAWALNRPPEDGLVVGFRYITRL
jgi:hypothetical protein